jgi:hypothetical protein
LQRLNATFNRPYTIKITNDSLEYVKWSQNQLKNSILLFFQYFSCNLEGETDIRLDISTDSNITVQTDLFEALYNVTNGLGINLYTDGKCLNKSGNWSFSLSLFLLMYFLNLELVTNVTSCYLFYLCNLCGTNPKRGICLPETHLSQCRCFTNTNDSSSPYTGEFCLPTSTGPALSTSSPSNWTPIIVGVLAGLAGLLCTVTCCLLSVAAWRRRRQHPGGWVNFILLLFFLFLN